MHPKILIVGTSPYDKQGPARAFESYFRNWERENLIQIFTSPIQPKAGHCSKLYQVTDSQILKRWFSSKIKTGVIYNYEELPSIDEPTQASQDKKSSLLISKLYEIGKNKTPFTYLLRGILWKHKYWCTSRMIEFVDEFKPECVFLAFSDDFFILRIALYFAEKYNIPIVSCIGDDYYFNKSAFKSPLNYIYKKAYKKLVRSVFRHGGSAAYIGDKIKDKYNKEFGITGGTVYLSSEIRRHEFKPINKTNPKIVYCGNIRLGRNHSLNDIGCALGRIDKNYVLDVYSSERDKTYYAELQDNDNVCFHGAVPYSKVMEIMRNSDILVVVEGFSKKDINITRYSLSTKVADSLATGGAVFAYGSIECGAIEYLQIINCAAVCTTRDKLDETLEELINNVQWQKNNYSVSEMVVEQHHTLKSSNAVFEDIVERTICEYKKMEIKRNKNVGRQT